MSLFLFPPPNDASNGKSIPTFVSFVPYFEALLLSACLIFFFLKMTFSGCLLEENDYRGKWKEEETEDDLGSIPLDLTCEL